MFRNKGFTLIELLVVMAIISILASIMFPVFAQAREKARTTQCLSNVKQIGMATHMYAQDYDETMPLGMYVRDSATKTVETMYDELMPYQKSSEILQCLTAPKAVDWTANLLALGWQADRNFRYSSYVYNVAVFGDGGNGVINKRPAMTLAGIQYTTDQPIINDGWLCGGTSYYMPIEGRHNGGLNVVYMDGHAKWFKATKNPKVDPKYYDTAMRKQLDEWIITSGPFRSPNANYPRWEFLGIVVDPQCPDPAQHACVQDTI